MSQTTRIIFVSVCLLFLTFISYAQDSSIIKKLPTSKYLSTVSLRCDDITSKIDRKTDRLLRKLMKEEDRLKKQLQRKDSSAAARLFGQSKEEYEKLLQKLRSPQPNFSQASIGNYIPYLDTLKTSLGFINTISSSDITNSIQDKIKNATVSVDLLGDKLNRVASIQKLLRQRRQYLKEQLKKFGLDKQLKQFNKEVYYYSQMIRDYKEILSDPKKIEKEIVKALIKVPAFKEFFGKNSMLASIFGAPGNSSGNLNQAALNGVQTRASVQQLIQTSVVTSGPNPAQFIQQQLQTANDQLSDQKNRISFTDISGNPEQQPEFKTNQQKTKRFIDRIELGANVQFSKTNTLLPTSGDFAITAGYKLNDNGIIGVGSSYKLGLGTLKNIRLTHQGFGLRSFIDWKIKGNFYIAGGYEKNYLPQLENIILTQQPDSWQESGLVGITKKTQLGKKRKMSLQLLFDFLSYQNIPRSQPILFRTGINF